MKRLLSVITIGCIALLLSSCDQKVEQPKGPEVGKPAPGFTLTDTKGKTWSLSELKGQVVFVNFWATWCPPCREEMPSMQKIYTSLPSDKFKLLSILNNDRPDFAESLAATIGFTFPILVDPGSKTGRAYGLTGVPETYIIDKQGILREKFLGPMQWDSPRAMQMLMKYIEQ